MPTADQIFGIARSDVSEISERRYASRDDNVIIATEKLTFGKRRGKKWEKTLPTYIWPLISSFSSFYGLLPPDVSPRSVLS